MTRTHRRALITGIVLLATTLPACPSPSWAAPAQWRPRPADLIQEVNRRRAGAGCRPVRLRVSLSRAAQRHSTDMSRHKRLSHTGSDGSRPPGRMRAAGFRAGPTGEVIGSGPDTARAAVRMWLRSPSHRTVVLTCRYTDAGVGVARGPGGPWWTLDLAARR
ncbi:CAP domain-containing protein [Streptomyces venezuelae]|uniref:CAP domain-containing protein n=1 Tax=Streptomyces venezuelae TaxID=54571 RepID=A0A5P2CJ99_STRVZ|nr:CAP domain-containing protein [Streptomyces venezuelae]QES41748.1 CAP domain-containing protein [Streptomyces venezuelae]